MTNLGVPAWGAHHVQSVREILHRLASQDPETREDAEEAIRSLAPEDLQLLLHAFGLEEPGEMEYRRRINAWAALGSYVLGVVIAFPLLLLKDVLMGISRNPLGAELGIACGVGAFIGAVVWYIWHQFYGVVRNRVVREAIFGTQVREWPLDPKRVSDALASVDNPSLLGVLLRARMSYWCRVGVRRPLVRLLPRLTPEDRRYLPEDEWEALCEFVFQPGNAGRHPDLTIAVLKAIQNLLDARQLGRVRRLASRQTRWLEGKEVLPPARECLRALEQVERISEPC